MSLFTEEDLKKIYAESEKIPDQTFWEIDERKAYSAKYFKKKNYSLFMSLAKYLGLFVLFFVVFFIVVNGPAIYKKTTYAVSPPSVNQSVIPKPIVNSAVSNLIIPKISVNAPIIWDIAGEEITQNLENGVVHYKGTALPGNPGNVFITGHSSYYLWSPGSFKSVFAILDKLSSDDLIYIQYKGINYTYKVTSQKIVGPDDVSVLEQTASDKMLTLMTCTPVGTNLQRLIIIARQVSP